MSISTTHLPSAASALPSAHNLDPAAAFLSYLVPGLGQLAQGRISKGLLFFVGVYGLFFYGLALGQWHNVYFADSAPPQRAGSWPRFVGNLINRPQFAGQVWIGVAAWPAIYHYWNDAPPESWDHKRNVEALEKLPWWKQIGVALPEEQVNKMQRDGDKRWDLGWVYTVIAGVLNVLVIYDALAGPAFINGVPDGKGGRPA